MAGTSMPNDDSTVDECKTLRKLDRIKLSDDHGVHSNSSIMEEKIKQIVLVFERALSSLLGSSLPLPPRDGNGKSVDLFKIFLSVSDKGGFDAVTENGLWKIVAEECGFEPNLAASVKLVYAKYLDTFGRLLDRMFENETSNDQGISGISTEFEAELQKFLFEMRKNYEDELDENVLESRLKLKHLLSETKKRYYEYCASKCLIDEALGVDDSSSEKTSSARKRKRETKSEILNWIDMVAKNPYHPETGTLPERSKWSSHGYDEIWKQILLFRAAVSRRKHMNSSAENYWQTHQEMHPCMYNDAIGSGSGYNLRKRPTLQDGNVSDKKPPKPVVSSDTDSTDSDIGSEYQAEVSEWTGASSESDSKWLGTRVWPLDREQHNRLLIERDPIGTGRKDSCGCQELGSVECVRFHVSQKAEKLKLELGMAFHKWRFNEMGEQLAASWSVLEHKKVNAVIRTRPNLDNIFLNKIHKILPSRTRAEIVSYFYNVVMLQRRAKQNRTTPLIVDSD